MSTIDLRVPPDTGPQSPRKNIIVNRLDNHNGTYGVLLFIATEGFLFVMLFAAYFYLAKGGWNWVKEEPPALHYAIPMLFVLLVSSGVVFWGERQVRKLEYTKGRIALAITILLGMCFLGLSAFDYKEHLQVLTPRTNAYGSIFYTITTLHMAHICLGLFILIFVLLLRKYEPRQWTPYRPYYNASIFWHFNTFIWMLIVAFLYVAPNVR